MPLGYFPPSYPDELLYSICARTSDLLSLNGTRGSTAIFGNHQIIAVTDLPGHLNRLLANLPIGHHYTIEGIINRHTLLPYYGPFLTQARFCQIWESMCEDNATNIHSKLGLIGSKIPLTYSLQYCPECVTDDRHKWGETYWHRVHQLPGVVICPTHSKILKSSYVVRNQGNNYSYLAAENTIDNSDLELGNVKESWYPILRNIALDSQWLLEHPIVNIDLPRIFERYREKLAQRSFATDIRVHLPKLYTAFENIYSTNLLRYLHCDVSHSVAKRPWLRRFLHGNNGASHPLYHILFLRFLEMSPSDLFSFAQKQKPIILDPKPFVPEQKPKPFGEGPWPCLNKASNHYNELHISEISIRYKHKTKRIIGIFQCKCEYTYIRSIPAIGAGEPSKATVIRRGSEWEKTLSELWANSQLTLRNIAIRMGTSQPIIKQYAVRLGLSLTRQDQKSLKKPKNKKKNSHPRVKDDRINQNRDAWLAGIQKYPTEGRLFRCKKFRSEYRYLNLYDRQWICNNLGPLKAKQSKSNHVANWEERDTNWVGKVLQATNDIKHRPGRPIRVCFNSIRKQLGRESTILYERDKKMPLTNQAIINLTESRVDLLIRRIQWAIEQYQNERCIPTMNMLKQRAAIRKNKDARIAAALTDAINLLRGTDLD